MAILTGPSWRCQRLVYLWRHALDDAWYLGLVDVRLCKIDGVSGVAAYPSHHSTVAQ